MLPTRLHSLLVSKGLVTPPQSSHRLAASLREVQQGLDRAVEAADTKLLKMAGVPENLLEDVGDIEKYLSELTGDLGTTLTVPLNQVKENLPVWIPAISKEIHNVEEATQALHAAS